MALSWLISDYMDSAARECSITPPANWISATDTNSILIKTFLKNVINEALQKYDFNQLNRDDVITGTGATTYPLPVDYLRLADDPNAVFEKSPNEGVVTPVAKNSYWTALLEDGASGADRYYRLQGSNIQFFSALPTDGEVSVSYLSKNWKVASDGA